MVNEDEQYKERMANLRQQYEQVCASYHAIDDFRARILALLPSAAGLGSIILLATQPVNMGYLFPIGILGALITIGLGMYEWRGSKRCEHLQTVARNLERELGLGATTGQFHEEVGMLTPRAGLASIVVYATVFVGLLLLAFTDRA